MKSFFLYFFFSKSLPLKVRRQAEHLVGGLRAAQTGAAELAKTVAADMRGQSQKSDYASVHHMRSLLESVRVLHLYADNGVDLLFAVKETRNSQGFKTYTAKRLLALAKTSRAEAKRLRAKIRYVKDKGQKLEEYFSLLDQSMSAVVDYLGQGAALFGESPPKPLAPEGAGEAGEENADNGSANQEQARTGAPKSAKRKA